MYVCVFQNKGQHACTRVYVLCECTKGTLKIGRCVCVCGVCSKLLESLMSPMHPLSSHPQSNGNPVSNCLSPLHPPLPTNQQGYGLCSNKSRQSLSLNSSGRVGAYLQRVTTAMTSSRWWGGYVCVCVMH